MNKLLATISAGALLAISGALAAADNPGHDGSPQTGTTHTTPGDSQDASEQHPVTPPARSAKDNPRDPHAVYSAEIKKCESLEGDKKQQCIAAAKKKAGEM